MSFVLAKFKWNFLAGFGFVEKDDKKRQAEACNCFSKLAFLDWTMNSKIKLSYNLTKESWNYEDLSFKLFIIGIILFTLPTEK